MGLDFLFQRTPIITTKKKNDPVSQEMQLKIPILGQGLKFSKTGCGVSALNFFVK
jgi:hypothetical protein